MEPSTTPRDREGVQIKVWIPDGFYDLLKARAGRHRTSVAEEARRLMQLGLSEGMTWEQFQASLEHLERMTYDVAVNARLLTKIEESKARQILKAQMPGQSDETINQRFRRYWGQLRQEATEMLTRYLRAEDMLEGE